MLYDKELDVKGLNCPLPILHTKKTLATMSSGQVLRILATDSGSMRDFQDFADQTGHVLLSSTELNGIFEYFLKRR